MSPATTIMEFVSSQAEKYNIVLEQAEDEIAAINKDFQKCFSYLWWFRVRGKEAKLIKFSESPQYEGEHVNGKNPFQVKRQLEGKGYR